MPAEPMFDPDEALRSGDTAVNVLYKWLGLEPVEEPSEDTEEETTEP